MPVNPSHLVIISAKPHTLLEIVFFISCLPTYLCTLVRLSPLKSTLLINSSTLAARTRTMSVKEREKDNDKETRGEKHAL